MPNTIVISQKEFVEAELEITDEDNQPAPIDGVPVWSLGDNTIVSMEVSADGLTAKFSPLTAGSTPVQVTCDADLGAGTKQIVGTGNIEVSQNEAVHVNIVFGAPQPLP